MAKLKYASNGEQFRREAKDYVINMLGNKRKLHKKCGCYHSNCLHKYYDFDSIKNLQESGIEFTHCKICFKEK